MKKFQTTRQLNVYRRLSNGQQILVGQLAQNRLAIFFQYAENYLAHYHSISPFKLPFNNALCTAPKTPHFGLHGVFADSLPDGWGLLLMDQIFRQHGILPQQLTAMDRLAYIGNRSIGSLSYTPTSEYVEPVEKELTSLAMMGERAIQLYEGQINAKLHRSRSQQRPSTNRHKLLYWYLN